MTDSADHPLTRALTLTPEGEALTAELSGEFSNGPVGAPPEAGFPFGGLLAARLKTLVAHGVLEPHLYSERPPRNEYLLTARGKELYGVLVTLHAWGNKHLYGDSDSGVDMIHKTCGHSLEPRIACGCCGEVVRPRDLALVLSEDRPTVGDVLTPKDAA